MAVWREALLVLALSALAVSQTIVCPQRDYDLSAGSCYRYVATPTDYFTASRTCVNDGGTLVYITSQAENAMVGATYYTGGRDFWIGLDDLSSEGTFKWTNPNVSLGYTNWEGGNPSHSNAVNRDCVKFTSSSTWSVHSGLCGTSNLPFLCKTMTCVQSLVNPDFCAGQEPTVAPQTGLGTDAVIAIIVILIVIIAVIAIVVTFLLLWKFNNECFSRYVCPCLGGAKHTSTVHSLQQENERLRKQLTEKRVSLSGHFSHAGELSGVPDGRGGVLPTIKQVPASIANRPPALVLSRGYSRPSVTTPTRTPLYSPTPTPFFVSGRPTRQSAPAFSVRPPVKAVPPTQPPISSAGESDTSSESDSQLFASEEGGITDPRTKSPTKQDEAKTDQSNTAQ